MAIEKNCFILHYRKGKPLVVKNKMTFAEAQFYKDNAIMAAGERIEHWRGMLPGEPGHKMIGSRSRQWGGIGA